MIFFFLEESSQQRMSAMQDELMQMQLKYQREIERLEKENKELRKQILLRGNQKFTNKKIKVSKPHMFDMYSCIYFILIVFLKLFLSL